MNKPKYKKGDWIRFMRNGELIIGVVEYTRYHDIYYYSYITNIGEVSEDSIIEARSE